MTKNKNDNIVTGDKKFTKDKYEAALKMINTKYGKGTIARLGDNEDRFAVGRLETGLTDFDEMLNGGMPKSRVCQFWGPEGVGKTSLALKIASNVKYCVYIDAEQTLDDKRPVQMGVRPKRLSICRPDWGEEACDVLIEMTKASVPLIICDSIPALVPRKVLEEEVGKAPVALIPRLLSQQLFPRLIPALKYSDTTIIFINQVREKVGLVFGDPTDFPGGRALKHNLSLNVQLARKQWFGPKNDRIGLLMSCRVTKSKICNPFRECELNLSFQEGFVSHQRMRKLDKLRRATEKSSKKQSEDDD
jgi:recombination protein RecA